MKLSPCCLIAILVVVSSIAYSQESDATKPTTVKSHVERFSTPAMRAERADAEASAALQTNPNDAQALNNRSLARMRLGKYRDAEADLQRAVTLKSDVSDYHANLGYVLWRLGRATEAVTEERTALKLDEKNYTAHYQLGRFLLRIGDSKLLTEAATHLRRAVEIDPRQYEARFELLATYRALGDIAQALSQLDLLQDARPSDPRVTYVAALLAADRNDLNTAINGFREALRRDPSLYGAWQDLGMSYIKLNRWKEAAQTFAELTERQAESVEAAYLHALSLFNSGELKGAELEARRTLRLNAGVADAHTLLGIILASRGNQNGEAIEALQQAVALDPKNFDAQFNLGRVQYLTKDYANAVSSLTAALELRPDHSQARFFLGTTLEATGDSDAALKQYEELNRRDPQSPYGKLGLGALLVKRGKLAEAIDALRKSIELDSTNFEAHLALGRALSLNEKFEEAVLSLQRAVAISPERPDAHYQLGLALRRLGRTQEAAREFAIVDKLNAEFRTNAAPR